MPSRTGRGSVSGEHQCFKPQPPESGLYWQQVDDGSWEPTLVRDGTQYRLVIPSDSTGEPELMPDFAVTLRGPLRKPDAR